MTENDLVGNLTVKEFRLLMQQCLNDYQVKTQVAKSKTIAVQQLTSTGMSYIEAVNKIDRDWGKP